MLMIFLLGAKVNDEKHDNEQGRGIADLTGRNE